MFDSLVCRILPTDGEIVCWLYMLFMANQCPSAESYQFGQHFMSKQDFIGDFILLVYGILWAVYTKLVACVFSELHFTCNRLGFCPVIVESCKIGEILLLDYYMIALIKTYRILSHLYEQLSYSFNCNCLDSPRQGWATFVTKGFWQGPWKPTVCNKCTSILLTDGKPPTWRGESW